MEETVTIKLSTYDGLKTKVDLCYKDTAEALDRAEEHHEKSVELVGVLGKFCLELINLGYKDSDLQSAMTNLGYRIEFHNAAIRKDAHIGNGSKIIRVSSAENEKEK